MNIKIQLLSLLMAINCAVLNRTSAANAPLQDMECPHDETKILIKAKSGIAKSRLDAMLVSGRKVARVIRGLPRLQVISLGIGERAADVIAEYRKSGLVEFAEPDFKVHLFTLPNDPRVVDGSQWAHQNTGQNNGVSDADIDSVEAWSTRTSAGTNIVAVLDTGVQYTHEDLAANMWRNPGEQGLDALGHDKASNGIDDDGNGYVDDVYGIDAIANSGNPADDFGHGTHVAGIIGGVGNNSKGGAGVAWDVKIMACRVVGLGGFISDVTEAIGYAKENDASIINASWGIACYSQALFEAIRDAGSNGIVFVCANGNDGMNTDSDFAYPSGYRLQNIVSVSATSHRDELATWSNFGQRTANLGAPGSNILSTVFSPSDPNNTGLYAYLSGTSMAAPHVAGALALLRAEAPNLPYQALIGALLAGTDKIAALAGKCSSGGRLNLNNALGLVATAPPNDNFEDRQTIASDQPSVYGISLFASHETGEPNHAGGSGTHSLWWTWTADFSGAVTFSTADSGFDTVVAAYTGSAVNSLTSIADNDNGGLAAEGGQTSSVTFTASKGTTYQIAVDGANSTAAGAVHLKIYRVSQNDAFTDGFRFDGDYIGSVVDTGGATKQAGEPSHAGNSGGRSVWWAWIAPASGNFTLTTAGSSFDTLLAAYTGDTVSSLSAVAANDDDSNGNAGKTSLVKFFASAGTVYRIVVDGKDGDSGVVHLVGGYDYALTDLGTLNNLHSHARQITENGDIIGHAYDVPQGNQYVSSQERALFWRNGTLYDISADPTWSESFGVNNNGIVVGSDRNQSDGWLYTVANGRQPFINTLSGDSAVGISDSGYVIGRSNYMNGGFGYSRGLMQDSNQHLLNLDSPFGNTSTYSTAVNKHLEVAGYSRASSAIGAPFVATYWSTYWNGDIGYCTPLSLGTLGGTRSVATDINEHADVVGKAWRIGNRVAESFLWSDGHMVSLGNLGCSDGGAALGINNRRVIVGSAISPTGMNVAYLYRDGVMIDLNSLLPNGTGWVLNQGSDINDKGQIVGYGTYQGNQRAFRLDPLALLRIGDATYESNGNFTFSIAGPTGLDCDIEVSSDLVGWSVQGTRTLVGGTVTYTDSGASSAMERYYRVRQTGGVVRSVNALGFVARSYPAGYSLLVNPFTFPSLRVSEVLASATEDTYILKWDDDTQEFLDGTQFYDGIGWFPAPYQKLNTGEGVYVCFARSTSVTFVGELPKGVLRTEMPAGYSFRGSLGVSALALGALQFPAEIGDSVCFWNATSGQYDPPFSFTSTGWSPSDPTPSSAQGFLVHRGRRATWTRNFTIW